MRKAEASGAAPRAQGDRRAAGYKHEGRQSQVERQASEKIRWGDRAKRGPGQVRGPGQAGSSGARAEHWPRPFVLLLKRELVACLPPVRLMGQSRRVTYCRGIHSSKGNGPARKGEGTLGRQGQCPLATS